MKKLFALFGAANNVESYFAKKHTQMYVKQFHGGGGGCEGYGCEFGNKKLGKYFSSGNYRELNDHELNRLYQDFRDQRKKQIVFALALLLVVAFFTY